MDITETKVAATAFGFAVPLSFNDLRPSMLVLAAPTPDQQYFGVVAKLGHDSVLIVLAGTDGPVPGPLDLGNCADSLWCIPGTLEIEPDDSAFAPGAATSNPPCFMIDAAGAISALVTARGDFGQAQRYAVDLSSGEVTKGQGKTAFFKGARFFIRQAGRRERFAWPDLKPDR